MNEFKQPNIPLDDVEGNVQRTLKQIDAPPGFRSHLRNGLMLAAQHRQTYRAPVDRDVAPSSWRWVLGAIGLGVLIGFVMIRLYQRQSRSLIE
jgi:hypothetical protein